MRNQDANRPQRIKIIIITIIAAIIIFIFGAWLITSAIKSVEKKQQANSEQNTTAQKDEKNTADNKTTEQSSSNNGKATGNTSNSTNTGTASNKPGASTTSPAAQYPVNQKTNTSNTSATDLPTTGPEDLLPTALLIGVASYLFFKNREIKAKLALHNS